jgi:hypothetical protein
MLHDAQQTLIGGGSPKYLHGLTPGGLHDKKLSSVQSSRFSENVIWYSDHAQVVEKGSDFRKFKFGGLHPPKPTPSGDS